MADGSEKQSFVKFEAMALNAQCAEPYQHSAFENSRRAIRLCKFASEDSKDQSHAIELEIAHYTLDDIDQYDYLDEDGIIFANFDKDDHVASFLNENGHQQRVKYTAISYCWGRNTGSHTISLNGHSFEVSENLYQLLVVLCDRQDTQRLFWIDQLCINQLDVNERNNQVSLMGYIYSSAEAVYAWLGNATTTTNLGLQLFEQLETCEAASEDMEKDRSLNRLEEVVASKDTEGLLAVRDLLTRGYWTRLWIVQEVAYARKLFFLCGPHEYQFGRCRKQIDFKSWNHKIMQASQETNAGAATSNNDETHATGALDASYILPQTLSLLQDHLFMLECRQEHKTTGYILSFDAVAAHGWRQCHDPRDKIFGLHALVAPSHRVQVDYQKSAREIFYEWVAETDTRHRRTPLDSGEVQRTIRSLHLAMGLGDISEQHLNELVQNPQQHLEQIKQHVNSAPESSRLGSLASMKLWVVKKRWQILSSVAAVVCAYWLIKKHLYGAGVS